MIQRFKQSEITLKPVLSIKKTNGTYENIQDVKTRTSCDFIINGGIYTVSDRSIDSQVRIDYKNFGKYTTWGFALKDNTVYWASGLTDTTAPYFVGEYGILVENGKITNTLTGGNRTSITERTAMGICGDEVVFYGATGTEKCNTSTLSQRMLDLKCSYAINLDGGGSTQYILPNKQKYITGRCVSWYICGWLNEKKEGEKPVKYKVTADVLNCRRGASTAYAVVKQYVKDDIINIGEIDKDWGKTDCGWVYMSYVTKLVESPAPPAAADEIIKDFIPRGNPNRPGKTNPAQFITIHNTGNPAEGANAQAHAKYLKDTKDLASWHFTVDSNQIYQHLPLTENAYHAGDGGGDGNRKSIGIEICINSDGDLKAATDRAVGLVRRLMGELNLSVDKVVQHNRWSGKNCPEQLRQGEPYSWAMFIEKVRGDKEEMSINEALAVLSSKGVLSDVAYWTSALNHVKNLDFLFIKMAQSVK